MRYHLFTILLAIALSSCTNSPKEPSNQPLKQDLPLVQTSSSDPFYDQEMEDAIGEGTQTEMNINSYKYFLIIDQHMNEQYNEVLSLINDQEEKNFLSEAQKNWTVYRLAQSDFEGASFTGGSIQALVINRALIRITKTRIKELEMIKKDMNNL